MSTLFHRRRRPVGFVRRSISVRSGFSRRLGEIRTLTVRLTSICPARPRRSLSAVAACLCSFLSSSVFRHCRHSDDGLTATTAGGRRTSWLWCGSVGRCEGLLADVRTRKSLVARWNIEGSSTSQPADRNMVIVVTSSLVYAESQKHAASSTI